MISDNVHRALCSFFSFNVNAISTSFDLLSPIAHFSRYITEVDNDNIKEVPSYNIMVSKKSSYLHILDYIPITRKTFGTMIKDLSVYRGVGELNTTKDKDGNVYYGCKGLILDNNLNPLVLTTITYKGEGEELVKTFTVRISPRVFLINKAMEKGIQKYLIEFCSSTQFISYLREQVQPNIIINNDIDKFIQRPTVPNSINTNNNIQEFLINNKESICL